MKCFVIALKSEADFVIRAMDVEKDYIHCGKRVVVGELFGETVGVVICGVGKVNAASGTQYALDLLGADVIINVGVAGGLNDGVKVGGVYSVGKVVQYDFDLTQLNGTAIGTLNEFDENFIRLSPARGFEEKTAGTGDRFNDSREDFLLLTGALGADLRDMELGAIAQVCAHATVKCYAFKAVSDMAGNGSTTEQYKENLEICFNSLEGELENMLKAAV